MKRIWKIIKSFFLCTIIITSAALCISTEIRGYTNICGISIVQVLSNSMLDSGIEKGDAQIIYTCKDYDIGDIVAFYYGNENIIIYHQIIGIDNSGNYITKGTSNSLPEVNSTPKSKIIGKQLCNLNVNFLINPWFKITLILTMYLIIISILLRTLISVVKSKEINDFKWNKHSSNINIIVLVMLIPFLALTGTKVWASTQTNLTLNNTVSYTREILNWIDVGKLSEDSYDINIKFLDAINNINTEAYNNWKNAWNYKVTNSDYISNKDKNAKYYVNTLFEISDATIIIKEKSDTEYDLYITYEQITNPWGTVSPVYKTTYFLEENTYLPVQSWIGKCNKNIYSIYQLGTYTFDTESFVAY